MEEIGILYLCQFGNVNESGEVFEIRAFIIEFAKAIMLRSVSLSQWL